MRVEKIEVKRNHRGRKREKPKSKVYNTKKWKVIRERVKQRDKFCVKCLEQSLYNSISDIDHIIPISEGGQLYAMSNLQGLCKSCHSSKTISETRYKHSQNEI